MQIPYDHSEKIKQNQHKTAAGMKQLDASQVALLIVPEHPDEAVWEQVAHADVLKTRYQRALRRDKEARSLATDLPNDRGTHVILQCMDPADSSFAQLVQARELAAKVRAANPSALLVQLSGLKGNAKCATENGDCKGSSGPCWSALYYRAIRLGHRSDHLCIHL